jgi:hypothetical protein
MTTAIPKIVGPEYLSSLLLRSVDSIRMDASRRPQSLPPRLILPNTRKLMWVEDDVLSWLNSFRPKKEEEKKKVGRPSTQVSQQYPQA